MKSHLPTKLLKTAVACLGLTALTLATHAALAWGPADRPTYTNASPADFATFNSITDNVGIGDERNFVRVREAGTSNTYVDELEVVPGKEYEVMIYYHNDAGSNTNSSGYGVATDVRASSAYPTLINPGERGMISGFIYWKYFMPGDPNTSRYGSVWDEAYLTTSTADTVLRYKTGTATIHNSGAVNGSVLSTDLFAEQGTYLGFNKLTGVLPGCAEYSGYITYTLVAESTTSELTKEISTDGATWSNAGTVKPGEFVTYRVSFRNTGNTTMTNVTFKDTHSDDLTLRAGSTTVFDANNTSGKEIGDIIDISGYNVGDVGPGALVSIIYQMKTNRDISDCTRSLSNKISVEYNGELQQESATLVSLKCDPITIEKIEDAPCDLDSTLPGCAESPNPAPEETPDRIVNTGPVEIVLAVIIVLGIAGGGFYFWRTRHTLRTVENRVSGKSTSAKDQPKDQPKSQTQDQPKDASGKTPDLK